MTGVWAPAADDWAPSTRGLANSPCLRIVEENDPIWIFQRQCHGGKLTGSKIEGQPFRRYRAWLDHRDPFEAFGTRNIVPTPPTFPKLFHHSLREPDLCEESLNPGQGSDAIQI